LIPSGFGGIFTGILLAISRLMGETAPLMLTALGASVVNWNIMEPTSAVPLLIWEFYNDPNLVEMVWSSSLLLLIVIFLLNGIAKFVARKWKEMELVLQFIDVSVSYTRGYMWSKMFRRLYIPIP